MNELAKLHCSTVTAESKQLSGQEIDQFSKQITGWKAFQQNGEMRLEKSFKFQNFTEALAFTDQVGKAANEEDHHPAILTEWGKVTVTWWTHKVRGLHQNDFIMAAKTDQLYGS